MAAAHYRAGSLPQAALELETFMAAQPTHHDRGVACVMLGQIRAQQKKWAEAESVLAGCAVPKTLIDMHGMAMANALVGLDRHADAVPHFTRVEQITRSPLSPRAGFAAGDALFAAGEYKQARQKLTVMLDQYPEYPEAELVRYRIARAEEHLGRKNEASKAYKVLTRTARDGSRAKTLSEEGLARLGLSGVTQRRRSFAQKFDWAFTLRKRRRWPEALAAFQTIAPDAPRREKATVHYQIAKCQEALDQYEEALASIDEARRYGSAWSELLDMKVRLLRKMGRTDEAVEIVRARAGGSKKVKALAAAQVYYEDGRYNEAFHRYKRYLRTRHNRANQWKMAWITYRAGYLTEAEERFGLLVGKRGIRKHKAEYWLARTKQKLGRDAEAAESFAAIFQADTAGYYGIQAANRLLDLGHFETYRQLTGMDPKALPSHDDLRYEGGSILWNGADGSALPRSGEPDRSPELILQAAQLYGDAFPELMRAYDRYRMGFDEQARIELRSARAEYLRARRGSPRRLADRPATLWFDQKKGVRGLWGSRLKRKMGLNKWEKAKRAKVYKAMKGTDREFEPIVRTLLVELGDPYWTRKRAFNDHWRTLRGVPTDETRHIFKAAYPLAFEDTLREETERYRVSPFLISALTRVESGFNELAVSYAGARGLMQVMPVTGNLIAQRKGDTEFSPALLLDPRWSIAYGSWYIDQLLHKFHGQEPLAIISYNCGPHRVDKWLARRGPVSEMDEFIEEVPYRQSRRYVKSVLRYIALYRRTYNNRPDLYVGQILDPNFKANINW